MAFKAGARREAGAKRNSVPVRQFSLHWGSGVIEEEVQVAGPYHLPTIQLLKFTEGEAAGDREVRFCYYDHARRFQRSPLIIGEEDLPKLRQALKGAPKLRAMLRRMLQD